MAYVIHTIVVFTYFQKLFNDSCIYLIFLLFQRSCDLSEISSQLSLIFTALAFYSVDLSSYFSIFLSVERIDGFKHIQFMSNLSPFTYWLSNYIFDFVFFFVIVFLRILCFKLIDDRDGFLHFQHPFGKCGFFPLHFCYPD